MGVGLFVDIGKAGGAWCLACRPGLGGLSQLFLSPPSVESRGGGWYIPLFFSRWMESFYFARWLAAGPFPLDAWCVCEEMLCMDSHVCFAYCGRAS